MAGVSGPMIRRSRADGVRFLVGLACGGAAAGLIVSLLVYVVGSALAAAVPERARLVALVAVCAALAVADLAGRTPHVWRQVPQSLARDLPPGPRGLVWGFDLGLLVTTQKAASLVWAAIAAVVLLEPALAPVLLSAVAVISSVSAVVWSLAPGALMIAHGGERDRRWLTSIRVASGTAILAAAGLTALAW